jgi:2'-5' RNA ligase
MPRLFFALQPQPAQCAAIAAATHPLLPVVGGELVVDSNLHLTLCFLGEVPEGNMATLLRAADAVPPPPCGLSLTQVDYWPGPRVLCLLPKDDARLEVVRQLADRLRAALQGSGIELEHMPFHAHVTVARKVPARLAHAVRWPQPLDPPLEFTCSGFVLMQSTRNPTGPRYPVLGRWPAAPGR